jgi:hypothetical protein
MASFGDALAALEGFRADLVGAQLSTAVPTAEAMAFRVGSRAMRRTPLATVHATGVGVRNDKESPGPTDFVIKVYVFETADVEPARNDAALLAAAQGVEVDVEHLPVQVAFPKKTDTPPKGYGPPAGGSSQGSKKSAASNPAQHQAHHRPAPAGVEIGPLGGEFVGTLGCFVRRNVTGPLFVLSNNHVLADVNRFPVGTRHTQPFSSDPADVICALSDFEPIRFPSPGSQPRNVIDAAIAAVTDPKLVATGRMLNIGNYAPGIKAPIPGMAVTKAGRTTGVTRGTIRAIRVRGVHVNYGSTAQPVIATFDNAITITGAGGQSFSKPGDSGSVILEQATGIPVALLFAGDLTTTTACDFAAACSRFNVHPV